jgi:hypothetical protein
MWPANLDGSNSSRSTVHGLKDWTEIELWMRSYFTQKNSQEIARKFLLGFHVLRK